MGLSKGSRGLALVCSLAGALFPTQSLAQTGVVPEAPDKPVRPQPAAELEKQAQTSDLMTRPFMTGDWWGYRSKLSQKGIDFFGLYTALPLANVSGGIQEGLRYQGLLILSTTIRFDQWVPWEGLSMRATTFFPHSDGSPTRELVGDRFFVSNIDLYEEWTLWDLWVQQELWDKRLSIRVGQWLPVEEFASGDFAGVFTGANFSRFGLLSQNFISFPLQVQGARVRFSPSDRFYFQTGIFDGNPDPTYGVDYLNSNGTRINWNGQEGFFTIHEAGMRINQELKGTERPATYKAGVVYHSGEFFELPNFNMVSGNFSVYGAVNQVLWWEKDEHDKMKRAVGLNFRMGLAPDDRNFFSHYFDAGLGFPGILPGRPDDVFASAIGFGKVSSEMPAQFDYEAVWETTYQIALSPWWKLQPTVKYVVHPGGSDALPNAVVVGTRVNFVF